MSRRISSADVAFALGYTPYDAANPSGYLAGPVSLPLGFIIGGKPAPSAVYHLIMATRAVIPDNLAGTVAFSGTSPAVAMPFTVNKLTGGLTSSKIGTITISPNSSIAFTLSQQAGVVLSPGDVLQLVAPPTQDASGADIGITILTTKG